MKITKAEKIWLIVVVVIYICYNLPFVPSYGNANAAIIHGICTLLPLWIAIYVGLRVTIKKHPLREVKEPPKANPMEPVEEDAHAE